MGMHSGVRAVLDPPIEITRPIPKLALLPLFIIWFGIGELSKTIVIITALFPLISISAMQAVRAVSVRKIHAAQSLGASPCDDLLARAAAGEPARHLHRHARVGGHRRHDAGRRRDGRDSDGVAWMALTAADFVQTDIVLVGVLIMAVLGYSLDRVFFPRARTRDVHWSGRD
jgi:taurine transport system permease protein